MILELTNPVQPYPWGSKTVIAELLGEPSPSAQPQAELWLGAHPRGPSLVADQPLGELVAADPETMLGAGGVAEFGPRLPFLLKVLAADRPLSIQVHPSAAQASAGYADEEARGVPVDAGNRNYKDDWPKPELLCALTDAEALCGFRDPGASRALFDELVDAGAGSLRQYADLLGPDADLGVVVERLLTLPAADAADLVADVERAAGYLAADRAELVWAVRLAAEYPGDPGVVVALLLNYVRLRPGEALYLPAGNMHAYLRGAGVELMASSDNVLRGGLTGKHVDVPELLNILDATPMDVAPLTGVRHGAELVYETSARHFRLSRVDLAGESSELPTGTPQILLCVDGDVDLHAGGEPVRLIKGRAAFVAAGTERLTVEGTCRLFRATTPGEG